MVVGRCEHCGTEEYMPFVCKFCKGRFCSAHRLPENHACQGLEGYKERIRAEGRIIHTADAGPLTPKVRAGAAFRARWGTAFAHVEGRMAYVFLGIIAATFITQFILSDPKVMSRATWENLFVVKADFYLHPWTLVTSIFSHGSFNHFFVNALVMFFFAPPVEKLIGTKRFTGLFLISGVLAGLVQVLLFDYLFPGFSSGALGASGALMGVMGTLVILAPTMSVLLMFIIPVPLWLIVALYAMLDLLGALSPGGGVAHLAHLTGLGIGLLYGLQLRKQGLRAHVERPASNMRRYF